MVEMLARGRALRVLEDGRRALERSEVETETPLVVNHITAHGSTVQVQNNSPNAAQTAQLGDEIQDAKACADQQRYTRAPDQL